MPHILVFIWVSAVVRLFSNLVASVFRLVASLYVFLHVSLPFCHRLCLVDSPFLSLPLLLLDCLLLLPPVFVTLCQYLAVNQSFRSRVVRQSAPLPAFSAKLSVPVCIYNESICLPICLSASRHISRSASLSRRQLFFGLTPSLSLS